jgi:2-(1,2-epoxy-1,2-dihydrophenyl)acetyl-CoA isomerase
MPTATDLSLDTGSVRCHVHPPVAEVVLDRPEQGNTFTAELLNGLADATTRLATRHDVRVVVVRGNGRNFSYGADVDMLIDEPVERRPQMVRELMTRFHQAVSRLARLEVPLLGVAHGAAVGGGLSLLAACDVVVAAESARFRAGWTGVGLTMDGGSGWFLPRVIGLHRSFELVYTNRIITAVEAESWGLVNWVVPDEELERRTAEFADMLATGPTRAFGACRRLVLDGGSQSFETHLENEAIAFVRAVGTSDADEGVRAFRARRTPRFRGA